MKSIITQVTDECYICRAQGALETHHCHHGSRRKKADEYGLTVKLCPRCHRLLHDKGYYDRYLQKVAQQAFENKYSKRSADYEIDLRNLRIEMIPADITLKFKQ